MISPDRTLAPPYLLSSDYSLARPEILKVGDVPVYVFREMLQEAVRIELIFEAGKWYESVPGISHFTSQMLSRGTKTKSAYVIAEGFDSLGAHLEITPGFDVVTLSLFALRKNVDQALTLLSELLHSPSFNADELRIMKEIYCQNLRVNNEKTSVVASKEIRKAIFGAQHPYGSAIEESDVQPIQPSALLAFFKKEFSLYSVYVVGGLTDQQLAEVIGKIPVLKRPDKVNPKVEVVRGQSKSIPRKNSVQASIRLGASCLLKSNSDEYFSAVMFNHVLGGFFGSRLMKNIREDKGLTYGIYSSMNHFLHGSFWVIGAEVNQQNAAQALKEIRNEIRLLQDKLIPESELENARNYFIGSWQSENATLFSVADKIKGLHLWGLPEDYYSSMLTHLQRIAPEQIRSIANTHFNLADLVEVQVG